MKKRTPIKALLLALASVAAVLSCSCKRFEGDITTPAWLQLDSADVVRAASGENERRTGWYTSDIDAVTLTALFEGDNAETLLGTFQLPCRIPVLREGKARYITIDPVVKQNGISATRILYPFLQSDTCLNLTFAPGETTFLGTVGADGIHSSIDFSYYGSNLVKEEFFENFEPLASSLHFTEGKVEWVTNDAEGARSGNGYGRISTSSDGDGTYFEITDSIVVSDPSKYIYLELDYKTDVEMRIGMRSPIVNGGNDYTYYALNLYPTSQWTKIYINLGRLWAQMNHYPKFHVVFHTLNTQQKEGETRIDNLKIITM